MGCAASVSPRKRRWTRGQRVTRRVIAAHELVIRNRLQDLSSLVAELHQAVSEPLLQTPVFVRTEREKTLAIAELVRIPEHDTHAEFLGRAGRCWTQRSHVCKSTSTLASGALYPSPRQ